jgi:hypothetical protein
MQVIIGPEQLLIDYTSIINPILAPALAITTRRTYN